MNQLPDKYSQFQKNEFKNQFPFSFKKAHYSAQHKNNISDFYYLQTKQDILNIFCFCFEKMLKDERQDR